MRPRSSLARDPLGLALFASAVLLSIPWLALGTIEAQRQRLPPAPQSNQCADAIQGTWRSHAYYPRQGQWSLITLELRQKNTTTQEYEALVDARFWDGSTQRASPLPCKPGHNDWTVREPSLVEYSNGTLTIRAQTYSVLRIHCGAGPQGYILDTFIGRIDPQAQEFVSVNRYRLDGQTVEDQNLFRRIACPPPSPTQSPAPTGEVPKPGPVLAPPPAPVHTHGGCGTGLFGP